LRLKIDLTACIPVSMYSGFAFQRKPLDSLKEV
jgi:hypothetical protein